MKLPLLLVLATFSSYSMDQQAKAQRYDKMALVATGSGFFCCYAGAALLLPAEAPVAPCAVCWTCGAIAYVAACGCADKADALRHPQMRR